MDILICFTFCLVIITNRLMCIKYLVNIQYCIITAQIALHIYSLDGDSEQIIWWYINHWAEKQRSDMAWRVYYRDLTDAVVESWQAIHYSYYFCICFWVRRQLERQWRQSILNKRQIESWEETKANWSLHDLE